MKRLICLLVALSLLFCLSAHADEADWIDYDSIFGFNMLYPVLMMDAYVIPKSEMGYDLEVWQPKESDTGAYLTCCLSQDPSWPNWASYGYTLQAVDEPDVEMKNAAMDMNYRLLLSPDGKEYVEEVRLQSPVAALGLPAGFEYVFDLHFTVADPDLWRLTLEDIVESAAFPQQNTHTGFIDLSFDLSDDITLIEVIVDEDAEPFFLHPDAGVTDFTLEKVTWDDETFTVVDSQVLYTADRFTGAEALCIYSYIPEMLPDLCIHYINPNGEAEYWLITESGEDGHMMLMDESSFDIDPE